MIEVSNLSKSYGGIQAIESLNFTIQKGEVVGFLGPNGAGKSTTMKIITGFMAPTEGVARVAGFDVFENPLEVKKRIGYLPETPPVYGDMFVDEYLKYVAELKGVAKEQIDTSVEQAIQKTQLQSVAKRLIQNLSKGFRQRVGIAQALVSNPEILILDEPTVGLDPKQVAEIRELIKSLRGQHTIILSTHILPEVEAVCERIIIINKGQIVAQESLDQLQTLQAGAQTIRLCLRDSGATAVAEKLKNLDGVISVQSGDRPGEWLIKSIQDQNLTDSIAELVLSQKWGLKEITTVKADLEDIFLKLTYGEREAANV